MLVIGNLHIPMAYADIDVDAIRATPSAPELRLY